MGYYDRNTALSMDYRQFMESQAKSIGESIKRGTDRVEDSMVRMQTSAIVASQDTLSQTVLLELC